MKIKKNGLRLVTLLIATSFIGCASMKESGGQDARGLTPQEISLVMRSHFKEAEKCYESVIGENKVVVKLTINSEGHVIFSAIDSSTVHDASSDSCLTSVISTWVFPKPTGDIKHVDIKYPFLIKGKKSPET